MNQTEGKIIRHKGPSVVQQRYLDLVKRKVLFTCKGHSLIYFSEVFPVEMARQLGVKPRCRNFDQLKKVWH